MESSSSAVPAPPTSVDDGIAAGLASDEEAPSEETHPSFLGSLRTSSRQSILPHAAFLAPRRGTPPRTSVRRVLSPPPPLTSSSTSSGFYQQTWRERRSHSPTGGGADIDGAQPRPMASRDPLLPRSVVVPKRSSPPSDSPATQHNNNSTPSPTQHLQPRKYTQLQGANRFFCFGRVMTASDNPLPFIGAVLLITALPTLWFVFVAPFTWRSVSPAPVILFAYTWSVTAVNMAVTAWRDPGVLPRYLDPDPPCTAGEGLPMDPEDPLAIPIPRIVRVPKGADLKIKWCETCGTYRPPRASHCRTCDNCVENIDHHCTFLNTCIGRRNYTSFFAFLIFTVTTCCIAAAFSALHLYLLTRPTTYRLPRAGFGQGRNFVGALRKAPLSAVMFILPIWVMMPVLVLLSYHVRLVSKNRTTVEQIRINTTRDYGEKSSPSLDEAPRGCCGRTRAHDPNPFASGSALRNAASALCRPLGDSWIDRYGRKAIDERKPNPATSQLHQQQDVEMGNTREKRLGL